MNPGDVISWTTAAVTLVGLVFAGVELRLLRSQGQRERAIEQRGVAVMWHPRDVPTAADADGTSASTYEFTVYNPGRLPIRDVVVRVTTPMDIRREHFDTSLDPSTRTLTLDTPVVAGGQQRQWTRRLRVSFSEREALRRVECTVSFTDLDGKTHSNRWGREMEAV